VVGIDWRRIPAEETSEHPGLINDLIAKKIDGMTVMSVFSPTEVERALATIESVEDGWHDFPFGSMLGMPLNHIGANSRDSTPYTDDSARSRPIYTEAFGVDPHQRLVDVLRPMSGPLEIAPPTEDGRAYNPGNIRRYEPGLGGLKAHAGNEFIGLVGDGAMHHLLSTTRVLDHMSYFVVLQRPEIGGQLAVYDLLWEQHPEHEQPWENADRDASGFADVPALRPAPEPGDLILFGGGWRWHCVEEIGGPRPRITYGGFAATSRSEPTLHLWA
jgi:hypothetical protein